MDGRVAHTFEMAVPTFGRELATIRRLGAAATLPRAVLSARELDRLASTVRVRRVQAHVLEAKRCRAAQIRTTRVVVVLFAARVCHQRGTRLNNGRVPQAQSSAVFRARQSTSHQYCRIGEQTSESAESTTTTTRVIIVV